MAQHIHEIERRLANRKDPRRTVLSIGFPRIAARNMTLHLTTMSQVYEVRKARSQPIGSFGYYYMKHLQTRTSPNDRFIVNVVYRYCECFLIKADEIKKVEISLKVRICICMSHPR